MSKKKDQYYDVRFWLEMAEQKGSTHAKNQIGKTYSANGMDGAYAMMDQLDDITKQKWASHYIPDGGINSGSAATMFKRAKALPVDPPEMEQQPVYFAGADAFLKEGEEIAVKMDGSGNIFYGTAGNKGNIDDRYLWNTPPTGTAIATKINTYIPFAFSTAGLDKEQIIAVMTECKKQLQALDDQTVLIDIDAYCHDMARAEMGRIFDLTEEELQSRLKSDLEEEFLKAYDRIQDEVLKYSIK